MSLNPLLLLRLFWCVFFALNFVLVIVSYLAIGPINLTPALDFADLLHGALTIAALVSAALSYLIPKFLLKEVNRSFIKSGNNVNEMLVDYLLPFLIRLSFIDSIGVYGLALALITMQNEILPFFLISTMGYLLCFPTVAKIRAEVSKH